MTDNEKEAEPLNLYTERKTSVIWDVKFFDGFVIARPVSPDMARNIRKIRASRFVLDFEEFCGDVNMIRDWLAGVEPDLLLE